MEAEVFWSEGGTSVPTSSHFFLAFVFAIGFVAVRLFLDNFVFQYLARIILRCGTSKNVPKDDAMQSKIVKCTESMWKFTYYSSMQLWAISIIQEEPWTQNLNLFFEGWPNQELSISLKHFYMCQCGFYLYSIAALLVWETRRKDFGIMMSHHIVTSILIGFSFITRFFRIGTIVVALHDTSDVFLEVAKLFKYAKIEFAASACFGLFALSWVILRLIYFPFWIIWASSYQSINAFKKLQPFPTVLYYVFNCMLITLLIFHMYWWKLICSMIMRQMSNKGKLEKDIRSDSEGED